MPTVTGSLTDFGFGLLTPYNPTITFTASGPTVTVDRVLATRPIVVTPDAQGDWTVGLANTDDMRPLTWYTVRIEWLDAAGGFVSVDFPDWKLFVPPAGGTLSDLVDAPIREMYMVWVVTNSIEPPGSKSGDLIYNSVNGDLKRIN